MAPKRAGGHVWSGRTDTRCEEDLLRGHGGEAQRMTAAEGSLGGEGGAVEVAALDLRAMR